MAHFKALVILPLDISTSSIQEKVKEMLKPYYSELVVEPYKEYLSQTILAEEMKRLASLPKEEIKRLAIDWEVSNDDLEKLAKISLDWYEDEIAGIDEYGIYRMTTINPRGKWDGYNFIEAETKESETLIRYPYRVADLSEVIPYAIITPDGEWYEAGEEIGLQAFKRSHLHKDIPISDDERSWDLEVQGILSYYRDHFVVALRCHV
jgi:hypothetical protein